MNFHVNDNDEIGICTADPQEKCPYYANFHSDSKESVISYIEEKSKDISETARKLRRSSTELKKVFGDKDTFSIMEIPPTAYQGGLITTVLVRGDGEHLKEKAVRTLEHYNDFMYKKITSSQRPEYSDFSSQMKVEEAYFIPLYSKRESTFALVRENGFILNEELNLENEISEEDYETLKKGIERNEEHLKEERLKIKAGFLDRFKKEKESMRREMEERFFATKNSRDGIDEVNRVNHQISSFDARTTENANVGIRTSSGKPAEKRDFSTDVFLKRTYGALLVERSLKKEGTGIVKRKGKRVFVDLDINSPANEASLSRVLSRNKLAQDKTDFRISETGVAGEPGWSLERRGGEYFYSLGNTETKVENYQEAMTIIRLALFKNKSSRYASLKANPFLSDDYRVSRVSELASFFESEASEEQEIKVHLENTVRKMRDKEKVAPVLGDPGLQPIPKKRGFFKKLFGA